MAPIKAQTRKTAPQYKTRRTTTTTTTKITLAQLRSKSRNNHSVNTADGKEQGQQMSGREFRQQRKEFNSLQETEETFAKQLTEERHRLEMHSLREEVREMQRGRERVEMEEQLKRAQTKVEEIQQEEWEKTQRYKVWREALERYRRDTTARRTHEDLMWGLRESAMKPREQEPPFTGHTLGQTWAGRLRGDIRVPVVNRAGRRRYHHAPPRIIQVDYLPSSPSSSHSPIAEAEDPGFGDTLPFGGEVGDRSPGCEKEEGACHGNVEELDDSDEPADAQEIDLEAGTMNHREEKLGE
ncbi:hypothetical protein PG993_002388 [Apiospora rasikravindrae]|uniref:Pinin/SDK/MemA protein domain-containing protein n=1 Tax=Apiospora rasikravindrae TaxID=990691 RepID=A0ABR1TZ64_9PEZI